jgi:glycosyltransferase involved in cell wall biosynthesis
MDAKRNDVELIVVDDGSTDERTRHEIARVAAQGIRVIRQENKGLAGARNAGISISMGEYILPLDADNRLRPAQIEHGIRILDSNKAVGVVYGDAQRFGTHTGRWEIGSFDAFRLLDCNYIDACAMYRRSVWEQNGGYDGTMPVQGLEDWDFWIGALEHGWQFAYVPEVLFEYRTAEESMITRARPFQEATEEFICRKHALFYHHQFARIFRERLSIRLTARRLLELIEVRMKQRLRTTFRNGHGT